MLLKKRRRGSCNIHEKCTATHAQTHKQHAPGALNRKKEGMKETKKRENE